MSFASSTFLLFLPVVFFLYFLSPRKIKPWVLLISSYSFYAYWDWRYTPLLLFSSIVDFYCGNMMEKKTSRKERRVYLYSSLVVNLGILCAFKYWDFIGYNFSQLLNLEFEPVNLLLPLGISFYTLQTLSYTFDIYLGKSKAEKRFSDFCLYVSFFPQLVAGPIERSKSLIPQLKKLNLPTRTQFYSGFLLIVWGLFLKIVIADNLTQVIGSIYFVESMFPFWVYWLTGGLALMKIYCDFMAYSEIARGVAKLFGVELSLNFRRPFFSKTLREFWQRWHISLTRWIGDYVFTPLAMKHKSDVKRNIITVFTLCLIGLWHGASWNFIIFGLIQGMIIISWNPIASGLTKVFNAGHLARKVTGFTMVAMSMMFTTTIFYISDMEVLSRVVERKLDLSTFFYSMNYRTIQGKLDFIFALFGMSLLFIYSYLEEFKKFKVIDFLSNTSHINIWLVSTFFLLLMIFFGNFSNEKFVYFEF